MMLADQNLPGTAGDCVRQSVRGAAGAVATAYDRDLWSGGWGHPVRHPGLLPHQALQFCPQAGGVPYPAPPPPPPPIYHCHSPTPFTLKENVTQ
jgi:hypothetical protein